MNQIDTFEKKKFFDELDLFRGFAIFLIVLGHMFGQITLYIENYWKSDWTFLYRYYSVLMGGGTTFFVFISGFLFYSVFYVRGRIVSLDSKSPRGGGGNILAIPKK